MPRRLLLRLLMALALIGGLGQQCAAAAQQPRTVRFDQFLGDDVEPNDPDSADNWQRLTTLVDQYRQLIARSLLRLPGACRVYQQLRIAASRQLATATAGNHRKPIDDRNDWADNDRPSVDDDDGEVDIERYILAVLQQLQTTSSQLAATFARHNATEPGLNVLFYMVTTTNLLRDDQLDRMLAAELREQCCAAVERDQWAGASVRCERRLRKRQPEAATGGSGSAPSAQKKQRFHAWGGKRSPAAAAAGAGGGGGGGGQPAQVVIRAPFHAWGGRKRSEGAGPK